MNYARPPFWRLKNLKTTTVFQQFTKWQYSSSSFSTLDLYHCKPNTLFKCNAMTFKHFKVCRKCLKYTLTHWVTCIQAVHMYIYLQVRLSKEVITGGSYRGRTLNPKPLQWTVKAARLTLIKDWTHKLKEQSLFQDLIVGNSSMK